MFEFTDLNKIYAENLSFNFKFQDLKKYAKNFNVPIIKDQTAKFIIFLLKILKPKKILELGSAIGYSALLMSTVSNAEITTIELDEINARVALNNFKKYKKNITIINKDAKEALNEIDQGFDFVFIDADKSHYSIYFEKTYDLLNKGGVMVFDNIFFSGMTSCDEKLMTRKRTIVKRMREFIAEISLKENLTSSICDIGDGILLIFKD